MRNNAFRLTFPFILFQPLSTHLKKCFSLTLILAFYIKFKDSILCNVQQFFYLSGIIDYSWILFVPLIPNKSVVNFDVSKKQWHPWLEFCIKSGNSILYPQLWIGQRLIFFSVSQVGICLLRAVLIWFLKECLKCHFRWKIMYLDS